MKYTVKYLSEVFSDDFSDYITATLMKEPADAKLLTAMMKEVEHYETRRSLQFVCFVGSDMIIFKAAQ